MMHATTTGKDGLRVLITAASAVIIIAGLQAGQDIILPIILASFLAVISYPVTQFLRDKCRLPHWLSVLLTVVIDFGFLTGIGFLVNYLAKDLTTIVITKYNVVLQEKFAEIIDFLRRHDLDTQASKVMEVLTEMLDGKRIVDWSTMLMSKAATILTVTTLVLILMTFFLGEAPRFRSNIRKMAQANSPGVIQFTKTLAGIQKYLVIKTFISILTGICAWILCASVGVDLPLLWAIVAFALNYIPTFGSIVAAVPPIMLAALTLGTTDTFIVAGGYLGMNMLLGQVLEPMLLGKQFGIATSVVLLSVVFWGWMWGPLGMLLAVPISMLLKLGLESSDDLRWIAHIIDNPPKARKLPRLQDLPPTIKKRT